MFSVLVFSRCNRLKKQDCDVQQIMQVIPRRASDENMLRDRKIVRQSGVEL